jgi:hypothetical protein
MGRTIPFVVWMGKTQGFSPQKPPESTFAVGHRQRERRRGACGRIVG